MAKPIKTLDDLTLDPRNANQGTERGRKLLESSLRRYGAGRSVIADRNGVVIAGNKTVEAARSRNLPVEVVETDGTELVVVQRTDVDIHKDAAGRELAYADNRIGELDLSWNPAVIAEDVAFGVNLTPFFSQVELDALIAQLPSVADEPIDPRPAPVGKFQYTLVFETMEQQSRWFRFVRDLKQRYPDLETVGARLAHYLATEWKGKSGDAEG